MFSKNEGHECDFVYDSCLGVTAQSQSQSERSQDEHSLPCVLLRDAAVGVGVGVGVPLERGARNDECG